MIKSHAVNAIATIAENFSEVAWPRFSFGAGLPGIDRRHDRKGFGAMETEESFPADATLYTLGEPHDKICLLSWKVRSTSFFLQRGAKPNNLPPAHPQK